MGWSMDIRLIATWVALVVSLLVAGAFVVMRVALPSDGARIPFYGDAWTAAGVRISPIDAPAAGLQDGDLVVTVGGTSMERWLELATDGVVPRSDDAMPIPYGIVRDVVAMTTEVRWATQPLGATLRAGWSVVLFSIAVVGLAAFVFAKRPDAPAAPALMIAACAAAGSSVPWFLGVTVSGVVQGAPFVLLTLLTGPLYMLLWPAGIHMALVFPEPMAVAARRRWLVPAVYAVALGAYALGMGIGRVTMASTLDWVGTWPLVQALVVVPSLLITLALFVRTYRRTVEQTARTRLRWAWLGLVAAVTIGLAGFWIPVLLTGRTLFPESWIGLVALPLPLGLAAGILRDRLFDIDVVVRRTFVYGGLTLGVVAVYVAVASAITALVGTDHGFGGSLLATGVAALVALPLRDGLQRGVERFLYGDRAEPWRVVRRLGQRLDLAADPDRVFPVVVDTVADALRLPYVGLEVVAGDGHPQVVAERGRRAPDLTTIPVVDGAERVGTLVLAPRVGDLGFRADELDLLADLARQAGAAIHARRMAADLVRSHEQLLLAREEERRRLRHDLHDGLGPTLAAIGLRAEASSELLESDPEAARSQLGSLASEVGVALADLRRLVDGLRPPALDELGLVGAIVGQATRLAPTAGGGRHIDIEVAGIPDPLPEMAAAVEVAAYRISVEAMTNAVRHADARRCTVRLTATDRLIVEVTDDGRGIGDAGVPGTGLESMATRATELGGSFSAERSPDGGTRISASIPLAGRPSSAPGLPSGLPGSAPS